jgi:hypothetical protein
MSLSGELRLGDCRQVLATVPDGWVHCCVTSPPYWGLRDYGVDGHPVGLAVRAGMGAAPVVRDGEYVFAAGQPAPRVGLLDVADSILVRNAGAAPLAFAQAQFELGL